MKRQWDSEELVEHFTLLPDESILLDNLSGSNRLGFALLLKFFQIEARFPISKQEIPKSVVSYIAKQVDVSPRAIKEYSFSGRTIERHRSQIRQFFGFRETTVEDAFELTLRTLNLNARLTTRHSNSHWMLKPLSVNYSRR